MWTIFPKRQEKVLSRSCTKNNDEKYIDKILSTYNMPLLFPSLFRLILIKNSIHSIGNPKE